ncbi:HsdM family class I SAM-dependent methyltransferase [Metabacillus iocasae]|uniref:site-specific DNA-methyltransferase (adenine-specific) n=1 Tax=Priestia iocasae TaxID=2291674 RepID=A0ABS2QXS7_9BACI|nr:class I SAM-dependent DNA methyltransferase [Metabacillus iocasae]MBM7703279.1 type I restriction enzyme M protein [Metabacillus iocasae]
MELALRRMQTMMRQDAGVDGDAQRISQLVWMLFLKIYDAKELMWEAQDEQFQSIIPEECRWRSWALTHKGREWLTEDRLLDFVNEHLFPTLKALEVNESTEQRKRIVKEVFVDTHNHMRSGVLLREVLNILNEIDFTVHNERHLFNDMYELIVKDLQSAGNAGEFYTPRAVTDFIVQMINPKASDTIADFACGTGGFLTSALTYVQSKKGEIPPYVFGIEKKPFPYLLAVTNLMLHNIDSPQIIRCNSLGANVVNEPRAEKFDVILMNPPYGGVENETIKEQFPPSFQSSETVDLFMVLIMRRLKENGKGAVVLPDHFLFGSDKAKVYIKKKLIEEFNLHTIVRLPKGVFEPYTDIPTNILFFDNTCPTTDVWYFQHPLPAGRKSYSKTKPLHHSDFQIEAEWWSNRRENEHAWKVNVQDIFYRSYNLDFKHPKQLNPQVVTYKMTELVTELEQSMHRVHTLMAELREEKNDENG